MPPGSGSLKIDFVGELNDKMKGFYRSKYASASGEIRYAAVTQFEVGNKQTDKTKQANIQTLEHKIPCRMYKRAANAVELCFPRAGFAMK